MTDEAGQLFRDIAIATSISTALSLLVALTIVPMMASRVLQVRAGGSGNGRFARVLDMVLFGWLGQAFSTGLLRCLTWLRRGVVRRLAVVLGMTVGSLALAWHFMPPVDYLPKGNRNLILAVVQVPPGFNLDQIERILTELEERYMQMPQIERLFAWRAPRIRYWASSSSGSMPTSTACSRSSMSSANAPLGIPGTRAVFVTQSPLFRRTGQLLGGTNVEIDVKGDDLDTVRQLAATIEQQTRPLPGVNFVRSSFEWGNPELQVNVDREKGCRPGLLGQRCGLSGGDADRRDRGRDLPRTWQGARPHAHRHARGEVRTQTLDNVVLYPRRGAPIRLADIAEIREAEGPTKIEHLDRDRSIKLTVNLKEDVALQTAIDTINAQVIHNLRRELPLGYSINVSGQAKDLDRTWDSLKWSFILAVLHHLPADVLAVRILCLSLHHHFQHPASHGGWCPGPEHFCMPLSPR